MDKKIIIISGFSGAGKDTVIKKVMQLNDGSMNVWFSTSDTTREPRDPSDHYNFISYELFMKRQSEGYYLEHNTYAEKMYGTPLKPIVDANGIVILQVDVNGMEQALKHEALRNISVTTVFIAAKAKDLYLRLTKRGDDITKIRERLRTACDETSFVHKYDFVLVNDDAKETAEKLCKIIVGESIAGDVFDEKEFVREMKAFNTNEQQSYTTTKKEI